MLLPKPPNLLYTFLLLQQFNTIKREALDPSTSSGPGAVHTKKLLLKRKNFRKGLRFKVIAPDYYTKKSIENTEKNNHLVNGNFG